MTMYFVIRDVRKGKPFSLEILWLRTFLLLLFGPFIICLVEQFYSLLLINRCTKIKCKILNERKTKNKFVVNVATHSKLAMKDRFDVLLEYVVLV